LVLLRISNHNFGYLPEVKIYFLTEVKPLAGMSKAVKYERATKSNNAQIIIMGPVSSVPSLPRRLWISGLHPSSTRMEHLLQISKPSIGWMALPACRDRSSNEATACTTFPMLRLSLESNDLLLPLNLREGILREVQ
jgi:hypothetical protein